MSSELKLEPGYCSSSTPIPSLPIQFAADFGYDLILRPHFRTQESVTGQIPPEGTLHSHASLPLADPNFLSDLIR
jgi:hypothetical protein